MVVHQSQHLDRRHKVLMPNKNILLKHYQVLLVIFMISFSCSRQVEENEILRLSILSRYMITKVAIVFSVFAIVGVLFSVQVVNGYQSICINNMMIITPYKQQERMAIPREPPSPHSPPSSISSRLLSPNHTNSIFFTPSKVSTETELFID